MQCALWAISGFHREADDYCVPLAYYASTFRDKDGFPQTSVRNCRYTLHNNSEERMTDLRRGGYLKSRKLC